MRSKLTAKWDLDRQAIRFLTRQVISNLYASHTGKNRVVVLTMS